MRSPREYRALPVATACEVPSASRTPPHLPQEGRSTDGALSDYPPKIGIEPTHPSS